MYLFLLIAFSSVVNVLIALKDPKDREKMAVAEKLIKEQEGKKFDKRAGAILPLEWLHCKDKHHINSIDSLLNHDDLVKEISKSFRAGGKLRPGREVIEGSLYEKQVTKWEGTVKEIKSDWHGTIVFKDHLDVRFVPVSVQPSLPKRGETVRFNLAFDRRGLSAWSVVREFNQLKRLPDLVSCDEDSYSENIEDDEDMDNVTMAPAPLYSTEIPEEKRVPVWDDYIEESMQERMQGVVVLTNVEKGFGILKHPDVTDRLFFHASQLVNPVKSLEGTITKYMILEFTVEKLSDRTRAANIRVLKVRYSLCFTVNTLFNHRLTMRQFTTSEISGNKFHISKHPYKKNRAVNCNAFHDNGKRCEIVDFISDGNINKTLYFI